MSEKAEKLIDKAFDREISRWESYLEEQKQFKAKESDIFHKIVLQNIQTHIYQLKTIKEDCKEGIKSIKKTAKIFKIL